MVPTAAMLAPGRTALLVIDVQHDFAAPDGAMGRAGADLSTVEPAVARIAGLAAAARASAVAVVFARLVTRPGGDPAALTTLLARRGTPADANCCRAGSLGATPYRLQAERHELVVEKPLYSAFAGTALDGRLRADGVDTLVLTGLTTECCILATAFDGFHRGYNIFVALDACAAYQPDLHRAALQVLQLNCALLVTADAVRGAWAEASL